VFRSDGKSSAETWPDLASLIDVASRSRFTIPTLLAGLAGCGGTPHEIGPPPAPPTAIATPIDASTAPPVPDPDLNRPPPVKLLAIDWTAVAIRDDADALALWKQIAPTGEDWEAKLDEIPGRLPVARQLAVALLHEGNFTCMPAVIAKDCAKPVFDVDPPRPTATLADPCLRRLLALWSITQLDDDDLPNVRAAFRAISTIPPPESQLVAAAIQRLPEDDHDARFELLAIAWKAGQRDVVNGSLNRLDVPHIVDAATKLHIDGALEVLSAEGYRSAYLGAVTDERLASPARTQAIVDLVATVVTPPNAPAGAIDKLPADLTTALVAATRSPDCTVAAAAARALDQHGDHRFLPRRGSGAAMRAMCVLVSYESLQRNDEASLLASFVPARGLELGRVTYDALSDTDSDGDGDPHTERSVELVARSEVVVPEIDDLIRAMHHCSGTICQSDDREFRFTWKAGWLTRLDVIDRPPCVEKRAISTP
jgi:hypothetical protein